MTEMTHFVLGSLCRYDFSYFTLLTQSLCFAFNADFNKMLNYERMCNLTQRLCKGLFK